MGEFRQCANGHANPSTFAYCSACGLQIAASPAPAQPSEALQGPSNSDSSPRESEPVVTWVPPTSDVTRDPQPPPYRPAAAAPPATPTTQLATAERPQRNKLLVLGSALGVALPVISTALWFLLAQVGDIRYVASFQLRSGYLSGFNNVLPIWYGQHFDVSLLGVVAFVGCTGLLIAAIARISSARFLAFVLAPLLGLFFLADAVVWLSSSRGTWETWAYMVITLAIEAAVPALMLAGAIQMSARGHAQVVPPTYQESVGSGVAAGSPVQPGVPAVAPSMQPASGTGAPPAPTDGLAIAALVLSIVGLITCLIGSVVGLIMGYVSRNQIRQSMGTKGGAGLATASIVIGWVGVGLAIAAAIIYALLVGSVY